MNGGGIIASLVAARGNGAGLEGEASLPLLGLLLLATALVTVPLGLAVLRHLGPRPPAGGDVPWNMMHALVLALVAFTLMTAASLVLREGGTALAGLWLTTAVLGAPAALAVARAALRRPAGLEALGIRATGNLRAAGAGVIAYLLVLPAWLGLGNLWTALVERFGLDVPMQGVMKGILALERAELAQAFLIATLVAPLLEEILFRGFLQPLFIRRYGVGGGIGVTSFLFAILHGVAYTPPLFALGFALGVIRWRTGRLSAVWAVHGLHNGLMLFLVLSFPELADAFSSGR